MSKGKKKVKKDGDLTVVKKDGGLTVVLTGGETDIDVILPDGKKVTLQCRDEGPSLDILLPEPMAVHNWLGSGMTPAKAVARKQEVRLADQLCIPL